MTYLKAICELKRYHTSVSERALSVAQRGTLQRTPIGTVRGGVGRGSLREERREPL
jgi:hypothetical protein